MFQIAFPPFINFQLFLSIITDVHRRSAGTENITTGRVPARRRYGENNHRMCTARRRYGEHYPRTCRPTGAAPVWRKLPKDVYRRAAVIENITTGPVSARRRYNCLVRL